MTATTPKQRTPRAPAFVKPRTYADLSSEASKTMHEAGQLARDAKDLWAAATHARFVASGGCEHCHGRGWIVTWDTMDHMDGSDATYGPCPEAACTPETRKATGLDLSMQLKHDRWNSTDAEGLTKADHMYQLMVAPFVRIHEQAAAAAHEAYRATKPLKGDRVVVVRGRKVPIGTVGVVAFIHDDGSLLIKQPHDWEDRKAPGTWVVHRNVEKVVR